MFERFLGDRVCLYPGNCLDVLAELEPHSLDACVTDPPYHLVSISERFGPGQKPAGDVPDGRYGRLSRGFMGKVWDRGDIAFQADTWRAVLRVLKPGAHLIAFGGTRTFARMVVPIEDAGFEIRDTIAWLYGSGFPKSHDVSKGIDRAAGAEREVVGTHRGGVKRGGQYGADGIVNKLTEPERWRDTTIPATDAARQWAGWGTALKPAMELIILARKPLSEGTVAANVLRWGTGAINIDGCRIASGDDLTRECMGLASAENNGWRRPWMETAEKQTFGSTNGRWPANVAHDGSEEVVAAFPDTGASPPIGAMGGGSNKHSIYGDFAGGPHENGYGDSGSAARFFYTAKADADDRLGSKHPTVKPLDLMQWLVRLVTPRGGTVLDPFAGTGTTGEAAFREGMRAVLIEAEAEYQADIRRRMQLATAGPDERGRESIKAKNLPRDDGPLFDWDNPVGK